MELKRGRYMITFNTGSPDTFVYEGSDILGYMDSVSDLLVVSIPEGKRVNMSFTAGASYVITMLDDNPGNRFEWDSTPLLAWSSNPIKQLKALIDLFSSIIDGGGILTRTV